MRIGDYKSASYKRLQTRLANRKRAAIARLCHRLDRLVIRADVVREKLRELDH